MRFPARIAPENQRQCGRCRQVVYIWMDFPLLQGAPCICERCIAEALGLGAQTWAPEAQTLVAKALTPTRKWYHAFKLG
jgi:hypothetical protein